MSQAALSLLTSDDDAADGEAPQTASQHAIALLEGRTSVPDAPGTYRDKDGRLIIRGKYPSLNRYAESPSTGETFGAMARGVAGGIAHGVGTLADVATGTSPGEGSYAELFASPFAPTTPSRLEQLDPAQEALHQAASAMLDRTIGTGPLAQTIRERVPQAAEAITTVAPFLKGAGAVSRGPLREIPPSAAPDGPINPFERESMGAAAAVPSRLKEASPGLQEAVRREAREGGVDREALDRHLEADSLPVKIKLTEGQATQDPVTISNEMNRRGKDQEFAARFHEQNQQLIDNLDEIRREAAPGAVGNDHVQNGQALIDHYKTLDEAAREEINAAYKAARDANGGDLPMNAPAFTAAADQALKKNMKSRYLPGEIAADLAEFRESGSMNFEQFENMRTNLAAEARKAERSGDGNAAHAVRIVRDALESIEPVGQAAEVKPLFDSARTLAKSRFDRLKADPAYRAAVDDDVAIGEASALADDFVQKFVVKGKAANIARMRESLSGQEGAAENIAAGALNYVKSKTGVNLYSNEGNFSQAGFNRALSEITPKLDLLVGPNVAEQMQTLGNVARNVQAQPRGSFVNNSNTTVAAHAKALAKGAAERGVNAILPGADLGTLAREKLETRARKKEVEESLKPGAGIGMKPKKGQP